jgi:hypothetical protein
MDRRGKEIMIRWTQKRGGGKKEVKKGRGKGTTHIKKR